MVTLYARISYGNPDAPWLTFEYDSNGNLLRQNDLSQYGVEHYFTFEYDDSGNMTKAYEYYRVTDPLSEPTFQETECRYDQFGNRRLEVCYKDSAEASRYEWTYDENCNKIRETYFKNGEKQSDLRFEYDANGKLLQSFSRNDDGSESLKSKCEYDAQGNLIEMSYYLGSSMIRKITYEYNSEGQRITQKDQYHITYEYNSEGCITTYNNGTSAQQDQYIKLEVSKRQAQKLLNEWGETYYFLGP